MRIQNQFTLYYRLQYIMLTKLLSFRGYLYSHRIPRLPVLYTAEYNHLEFVLLRNHTVEFYKDILNVEFTETSVTTISPFNV